eukprot:CAMPEP_0179458010 /NCGR_PEP_ID=MMETSP0799-20121207/41660_1 /TAXON_ID=46947 /ORGANISM="Geminigera cryophila, Strain CCMP2564" /LENGTH=30 /DNA_ID= /DNA_START= /DNA_END= /DNA_ORIENTATION=
MNQYAKTDSRRNALRFVFGQKSKSTLRKSL